MNANINDRITSGERQSHDLVDLREDLPKD
jgi:hypothetical protein